MGSAQVLPQAPTGVSSLSSASPLLSVPPPAVPSSSLPASQPQGVSGFHLPASSLLPSSSLAWPVSSAPGLGSPPLVSLVPCLPAVLYLVLRYFQLPLFCSAPLGSSAGLYGFAYPLSGTSEAPCLPAVILLSAPGFQQLLLLLLFALLLLAPLRVSLAFPRLRLAPYLVSLALLRLLLCCLGLLRLLPSSSLCLVRVLLSLCSWFVAPVAPVPEAFVPHLCLPPLTLVSALYLYRYLVAILTLAAGSSQAPLPPCSFSRIQSYLLVKIAHRFLTENSQNYVDPRGGRLGSYPLVSYASPRRSIAMAISQRAHCWFLAHAAKPHLFGLEIFTIDIPFLYPFSHLTFIPLLFSVVHACCPSAVFVVPMQSSFSV